MSKMEDLQLTRRTFASVAATGALAVMAPVAVATTRWRRRSSGSAGRHGSR